MSNLILLLSCTIGFGSALILIGLAGALVYIQKIDHRVSRLENNQRVRNAVVDTTEEFMPKFIEVQRQYKVLGAHMENLAMKADYMRNVGNPDASWPEIVKWHNEKYPTKPNGKK